TARSSGPPAGPASRARRSHSGSPTARAPAAGTVAVAAARPVRPPRSAASRWSSRSPAWPPSPSLRPADRFRRRSTDRMDRRPRTSALTSPARAAAVLAGAAVAGTVYATGWERNAFTVRRHTLPLLAPGAQPLTLLHVSDLHMMPGQRLKQRFVSALARLEPDLVLNTGDNLSSDRAVPSVVQALDPLLG